MVGLPMGKLVHNMARGAGGLLDVLGGKAERIELPVKPCGDDLKAIVSDWLAVGKDIAKAANDLAPRSESGDGHNQEGRQ